MHLGFGLAGCLFIPRVSHSHLTFSLVVEGCRIGMKPQACWLRGQLGRKTRFNSTKFIESGKIYPYLSVKKNI